MHESKAADNVKEHGDAFLNVWPFGTDHGLALSKAGLGHRFLLPLSLIGDLRDFDACTSSECDTGI